jgi:hypothetical protein
MLVDRMPIFSPLRHDPRTALGEILPGCLEASPGITLTFHRLAHQRRHGLTSSTLIMRFKDNI